MARDDSLDQDTENDESRYLLSDDSADSDVGIEAEPPQHTEPRPVKYTQRHSSFAQPRPDGTPRTSHRVRFDVEEDDGDSTGENGHIRGPAWMEEEDYMTTDDGRNSEQHDDAASRLPLLTGIEAPSVTVASADIGFSTEDLLESARPKSGMKSAFLNMANSIMCVYSEALQLGPAPSGFSSCANGIQKWRWHHRPAICVSPSWTGHGHNTLSWADDHGGLDDPADCHQFEAQRCQLVPSHGSTLLWEVWIDCHLGGAVGIVSSRHMLYSGSDSNGWAVRLVA